MEASMTLGERFKAARRMRGYSQTSVAKALGLCQGTISWLESGRARGATVRYYWRRLPGLRVGRRHERRRRQLLR